MRRLAPLVLLPVLVPALLGCGTHDGLRAADQGAPAPRAQGPYRLWPERPPAPPAPDEGHGATAPEVVPGVEVPGGRLRDVPPLDVLGADIGRELRELADPPGDVAAQDDRPGILRSCADPAAGTCPVRQAHYRDLTGDGREELILGIERPDHQLTLRVYAYRGGQLLRIMDTSHRVTSVELTARDLIVRSATGTPAHESRDIWAWSPEQGVMLPRLMEIVRTPAEAR